LAAVTDEAAYRWIHDESQSYLAVAACVSLVRGLDVSATIKAFGGDPSGPPEPYASFLERPGYVEAAAVAQVGELVVVVEPNGFQGSRREVLREASRMGIAVSVFWNVNLMCRFSYMEEADLITSFDPLFPDERQGSTPDRLLTDMAELPFGIGNDPIPAAFALAERLTGQALRREDIDGFTEVWPLVPLLSDLHPGAAAHHSLRYDHLDLVEAVAGTRPEVLHEIAAMAAERAAAAVGLDRDPQARIALSSLRTFPGRPLPAELADRVRRLLHRSSLAWAATSRPVSMRRKR
jgi:hypothetical protein